MRQGYMKTELRKSESKFQNKIRTPLLLSPRFWQNALHIYARTHKHTYIETSAKNLEKWFKSCVHVISALRLFFKVFRVMAYSSSERLPTCRRASSVVGLLPCHFWTSLFGMAFPLFLMLWLYRHYAFITASCIPKQGPPRTGEVDIWGDAALSGWQHTSDWQTLDNTRNTELRATLR